MIAFQGRSGSNAERFVAARRTLIMGQTFVALNLVGPGAAPLASLAVRAVSVATPIGDPAPDSLRQPGYATGRRRSPALSRAQGNADKSVQPGSGQDGQRCRAERGRRTRSAWPGAADGGRAAIRVKNLLHPSPQKFKPFKDTVGKSAACSPWASRLWRKRLHVHGEPRHMS